MNILLKDKVTSLYESAIQAALEKSAESIKLEGTLKNHVVQILTQYLQGLKGISPDYYLSNIGSGNPKYPVSMIINGQQAKDFYFLYPFLHSAQGGTPEAKVQHYFKNVISSLSPVFDEIYPIELGAKFSSLSNVEFDQVMISNEINPTVQVLIGHLEKGSFIGSIFYHDTKETLKYRNPDRFLKAIDDAFNYGLPIAYNIIDSSIQNKVDEIVRGYLSDFTEDPNESKTEDEKVTTSTEQVYTSEYYDTSLRRSGFDQGVIQESIDSYFTKKDWTNYSFYPETRQILSEMLASSPDDGLKTINLSLMSRGDNEWSNITNFNPEEFWLKHKSDILNWSNDPIQYMGMGQSNGDLCMQFFQEMTGAMIDDVFDYDLVKTMKSHIKSYSLEDLSMLFDKERHIDLFDAELNYRIERLSREKTLLERVGKNMFGELILKSKTINNWIERRYGAFSNSRENKVKEIEKKQKSINVLQKSKRSAIVTKCEQQFGANWKRQTQRMASPGLNQPSESKKLKQ